MPRAIRQAEFHTADRPCQHHVYLLAPHGEEDWRIWWLLPGDKEVFVGDRPTRLLAERLAKGHERANRFGA